MNQLDALIKAFEKYDINTNTWPGDTDINSFSVLLANTQMCSFKLLHLSSSYLVRCSFFQVRSRVWTRCRRLPAEGDDSPTWPLPPPQSWKHDILKTGKEREKATKEKEMVEWLMVA